MKNKKIFMFISIICIILFSAALAPVEFQNDTFYTIKVGEHIMQNGVDMRDPFSWHENLIYTYPHWLYDVCIYFIYFLGGFTGIYISTVILSCILGLSIYTVDLKLSKNHLVAFVSTILVMYGLENYIAARAQLVTFIVMVWVIFFIEKFLETKKVRYAVGLVLSFLLVANLHAATWPFFFVLFLPYIAEQICSVDYFYYIKRNMIKDKLKKAKKKNNNELIEKCENRLQMLEQTKKKLDEKKANPYKIKITANKNFKWLLLVILICSVTGLLTPQNTFEPYTHLYKLMSGTTTQNISEHQAIVLAEQIRFPLAFVLIFAVIGFMDNKIRFADLCMLAGLSYLTITSRRQYSLLVLIGGIIFARLLSEALTKQAPKLTEKLIKEFTDFTGTIILGIGIVIITVLAYNKKNEQPYINENSYPVYAVDYIKENLNLNKIKLFNEYDYGSYLLFNDIPVFIDSRADLYSPEFNGDKNRDIFRDFINAEYGHANYEEIFNKYGITHVILLKNSDLNSKIKNAYNYNEIYNDSAFVIYERNV